MRSKIIPLTVTAALAAIIVSTGFARQIDENEKGPVLISPRELTQSARHTVRVLPPLVLPNIQQAVARLRKADRTVAVRQLAASSRVLRFWAAHRWVLAPNQRKCVSVPWQRSCTVARHSQRLHLALERTARWKVDREIPLINDWRTAVRWVQRIYPGTESWLLAISAREGGWGEWVWYGGSHWRGYHIGNDYLGADTVGGNLQFRYSTFAPYWRQAEANLRDRGYIVPNIPMPPAGGDTRYAAWLSPLGQALTGAYMRYYGKDGCHWCLG